MNDKYYIPELSEFYIGYELEWKRKESNFEKFPNNEWIYNWTKHIITINDFSDHDLCETFHNITENQNEFRTKYLEGDDIRGLGFVNHYIKLKKFNTELRKVGYLKKTNESLFIIEHFLFNKSIKIYKESEYVKDGFEETEIKILYQGKCKSVNELKYLLKFLEI